MKSTEIQENVQYGTNANEIDKQNSSELLERSEVKGTPFVIVTENGKGSFITLGSYRLTESMSYQECRDKIRRRGWDLLVTVMGVVTEQFSKFKAMEESTKND